VEEVEMEEYVLDEEAEEPVAPSASLAIANLVVVIASQDLIGMNLKKLFNFNRSVYLLV